MLLSRPKQELVVPKPVAMTTPPSAQSRGGGRADGRGVRGCREGVVTSSPLPPHLSIGPYPGVFQLSTDDMEGEEHTPKHPIKVGSSLLIVTNHYRYIQVSGSTHLWQ